MAKLLDVSTAITPDTDVAYLNVAQAHISVANDLYRHGYSVHHALVGYQVSYKKGENIFKRGVDTGCVGCRITNRKQAKGLLNRRKKT